MIGSRFWRSSIGPSEATERGSSFTLHRGEILGWYGLVGSGRTELARSVIGADDVSGGSVAVRGQPAHIRSISDAMHRWRIGYVSENRQQEGLFLIHSIQRNIAAPVWEQLRRRFRLLWPGDERRVAQEYQKLLDIRTPSVSRIVASLSGGNKAETVLLIHGFGGDLDNWLFNLDALAAGSTVVALDLPGHGPAPTPILITAHIAQTAGG